MSSVTSLGFYTREVPDTWEGHHSFHAYMKMYCGFTVEESIRYAKEHLGERPAKVVVERIEITPGDKDDEEE